MVVFNHWTEFGFKPADQLILSVIACT